MSRYSEPFTEMAAAIERNPEDKFGGAFVIMLPSENGLAPRIIRGMITDINDPVVVLSLAKSQCEIAVSDIQRQDQNAFNGRPR